MKASLLIGSLFLALLVAVVLVFDMVRVPSTFAVKGNVTYRVQPDIARIRAGVIKRADNSQDAIQATSETMRNVLAALHSAGVPDADIATNSVRAGLSGRDRDDEPANAPRPPTYQAEQFVTVTVHDLSTVGKIAGTISDSGSNVWQVNYAIQDKTKSRTDAYQAAVEDAMHRADIYAAKGGFKRGRILKMADADMRFDDTELDNRDGTDFLSLGRGLEEINVTARRSEASTYFIIPKPEEQTIEVSVGILFEIR